MATYFWILWLTGCICSVIANKPTHTDDSISNQELRYNLKDLNSAASTYYSGWTDPYASSGYKVTGHGSLDEFNLHSGYNDYRHNGKYNHGPLSGAGYLGDYDGYNGKSVYIGYSGYKNGLEYNSHENKIAQAVYPGNGGYGGYGGNGGLSSYLGYNNPNYYGANHLGYGYYKKPVHTGIYGNGITPSLVTGYRGYSRK